MVLFMLPAASFGAFSDNNEGTRKAVSEMTAKEKEERADAIKKRVLEIKSMDKSTLTRAERKELRKELREMRKEAKDIGGGGVYISLLGILVIILVLIIIL